MHTFLTFIHYRSASYISLPIYLVFLQIISAERSASIFQALFSSACFNSRMGRTPCCYADGMNRGPWTPEEDQKLLAYIQQYGCGSWRCLPRKAGLQRCGKSCRLRWNNYLRPDIKRGEFSLLEDRTIIQLHALLGNRWSAIATHLPKRTENEIKNYWKSHLKKRLAMKGIDPVTHKPKGTVLESANGDPKNASNLSHMAQWESTRLEAEERLVRESQVCYQLCDLPPGFSSGRSSAAASGMLLNQTTTRKLAAPRGLDVLNVCGEGDSAGSFFGPGIGGNSCDIASDQASALGFLEINARDQTYLNEFKEISTMQLHKMNLATGYDAGDHHPNGDPKNASNLSHMAQWESTRLEAEERLVRESQLCYQLYDLPPGFSSGRSSAAASGMLLNQTTTSKLAAPRCLDVLKVWESVMLESILAAGNEHYGEGDSAGSFLGPGMGGNSCDIASGQASALGFLEINARDQTYLNEFKEISTMQLHKMNLATGHDSGDHHQHHHADGVFNNMGNHILSANSLITGSNAGSGSSSNAVEERARNEGNYFWHDIINMGNY